MNPLGIETANDLRMIPEPCIVDHVLCWSHPFEIRAGFDKDARREVEEGLDRWVSLGLGFARARDGARLFDPVEVTNFAIFAGYSGADGFWARRYVTTERRLVRSFHPAGSAATPPPAPGELRPRRFRTRHERDFNLSDRPNGSGARLRLAFPVEDQALQGLSLDASVPDGSVSVPDLEGLSVRLPIDERSSATLGIDAEFLAAATVSLGGCLTPEDQDLYTRPRENLIDVSPNVRALAAELASNTRDPERQVHLFFDYLIEQFKCGHVHYSQIEAEAPCDWPLKSGWYDCQIGAALLCALCRGRDIPARMVSGYNLYGVAPGYHYWSEVWLEDRGWTPFDLAAWHLSEGGREGAWLAVFKGAINYRLKLQVLPRRFAGRSSVSLPARWHLLNRLLPNGIELAFHDVESGAVAYRDRCLILEDPAQP